MEFTKDSRIVQDYVLLIKKGLKNFDEVPELFNLRDAVAEALGLTEQ